MSRRRVFLLILAIFVILDGLAWWATYRVVNAPSPEELQLAAAVTPIVVSESVQARRDNMWHYVSLNGLWRYRQTGSELANYFSAYLDVSNWHTMDIPRNWYLEGLNYHGVIWFRREFEANPDWQGRVIRLQFEGVDYLADVWLNGQELGHHEGYFQPFTFDVSDHLNYDSSNVLAVRVESPYEEYKIVWPQRKTLIKGVFGHHDTRPGGWESEGQEYNTGGIWNDVGLIVSDFVTVDDVRLQATWPTTVTTTNTDVTLDTHLALRNHANISVEATINLTLVPRNFEGQSLTLPSQSVTLNRGKTELDLSGLVQNPQLWWTWDRGDPNLYTVHVTVTADKGIIAEKETSFGFRQVLVGNDWTWTLNGQRFFPRGSNYISSQWLSETDKDWFRRDVQLMREANLNFIRLPAHVEPVEFYETADEAGILVWQEFPLQWGYTDAPEFIDEAQRQMQEMIEFLYNHPSIVVWATHNGSPWATPEITSRGPGYDARQNKRLDELLHELARDLDPVRYIHLNSGSGDSHVYPGWYTGDWRDFAASPAGNGGGGSPLQTIAEARINLPGAPFVTEYGAQALPNQEMLQAIFVPQELTYEAGGEVGNRWKFHNFQSRETFRVGVKQGETVEEFIASSQAYQANLVKFATETYRRAKYEPMQGIFHFMFVDNWPSITWSVLDYQRQPKAGFYALQTAMQPVLPSIDAPLPAHLDGQRWLYPDTLEKLTFALWIINDTLANYDNAQLNWRIERNDGQIVLSEAVQIDIRADEARRQATLRNISLPLGIYQLSVGLENAQGQSLGHNVLDFAIVDAEELAKESVTKPAEETEEASSPSESSSRLVPFGQPKWIGIGCYWPLNIPCR